MEYWAQKPENVLADLKAGANGLSEAEAAARLKKYGPNVVREQAHTATIRLLMRQFESPLVLILVFGALLSISVSEWTDAGIILVIVLGSAILGFAQEYRASQAVAALRNRLALKADVLRGGQTKRIMAETIVPGDVILLSAGNLVPADGVVLEASDFLVSEAGLTGESFPVEKQPGIVAADMPLAKRTNCVFLGTSVRSGTAKVLAVKTGRDTAFGAVAARLKARPPETEFARGIRQFGYMLIRVVVLMALFALTINQLLHRPFVDSLLFSIALTVGLSPELLPAIISVTLAAGARIMEKGGVIVRQLESIENLGSMDILCTDKTGTLTEGVLTLEAAVDPQGTPSDDVKRYAWLNAAFETGIENPLDAAILDACKDAAYSKDGYIKIDEIPYDFRRKRLMIVVAPKSGPDRHLIIVKGAFDNILEICPGLKDSDVASLRDYYQKKGEEGYRAIAVATREAAAKDDYGHDDEANMNFAGFLLFADPPKPEAAQTVKDLAAAGVAIKIISGDNRYVTAHIARKIGLAADNMLTGTDIDAMRDEALWQRAEKTDLFVEVDPQQKERIIRALQKRGHAVGYMGDGINDAPALHAADVGISVEQAVDVARESAEIVLLQRDLDVLRRGIEQGRRIFANTLKYINIVNSGNFGNMISMVLISPFLPFLPMTAAQILLNNFMADLPMLAISTDNVDESAVSRPTRWHVRHVFVFMVVFGLTSTIFDFLTFFVLQHRFHAGKTIFQTTWFVYSLLSELAILMALRTNQLFFRSKPGGLLLLLTLATAAAAVCIPYVAPLAVIFGFVTLPAIIMMTVAGMILLYFTTAEIAKRFVRL